MSHRLSMLSRKAPLGATTDWVSGQDRTFGPRQDCSGLSSPALVPGLSPPRNRFLRESLTSILGSSLSSSQCRRRRVSLTSVLNATPSDGQASCPTSDSPDESAPEPMSDASASGTGTSPNSSHSNTRRRFNRDNRLWDAGACPALPTRLHRHFPMRSAPAVPTALPAALPD